MRRRFDFRPFCVGTGICVACTPDFVEFNAPLASETPATVGAAPGRDQLHQIRPICFQPAKKLPLQMQSSVNTVDYRTFVYQLAVARIFIVFVTTSSRVAVVRSARQSSLVAYEHKGTAHPLSFESDSAKPQPAMPLRYP